MKFKPFGQAYRRAFLFALWVLSGLILTWFFSVKEVLPGLAQVSRGSPIVQIADTQSQEERGRILYEAGQFNEAIALWQEVEKTYQDRGDALNQARVSNNLSSAFEQLGQWERARGAIARSLNLLETASSGNSQERLSILAQTLNSQGSWQLAIGQPEQALSTWQQATVNYTRSGDEAGVIRSRINQAQALKAMGLYRRALTTSIETKELLEKQPNSILKTVGLNSLGSTLRLIGDLEQSRQVLQSSLTIARQLNSAPEIAAALFSLGDTARSLEDAKTALDFYRQAAAISPIKITKIKAELNQLSLLLETGRWSEAMAVEDRVRSEIVNLPASRAAIYAKINFAQSSIALQKSLPSTLNSQLSTLNFGQILAKAVGEAKNLGDRRSEAYALGSLGRLYEQTQQWLLAKDLTQQALIIAQAIDAPDITYRWQWQLGRLQKIQGDDRGAIAAYSEAVNTLQSLRSDLVAINPDIQFSFRDSVEPVYREFVGLLLQSDDREPSQKNLLQARSAIESLQLAELDNFFREACLDTKPAQIDRVDPQAAVIYPIILADRLEVILSLPQQPLRHYATALPESEVESIVENFRQALVIRSRRDFVPFSQQIYDWLIRPIETDLTNSGVKTLVFVLDGSLRNIPMAVLNDGKQYLIEKYSVALTPGLQLLDPKQLERGKLRVLSAGLTEARQGFPALENVALELNKIKTEVPSSVVLLNQKFTSENLRSQLRSTSFPIVHIATHGKFSSKAIETFIVAWDDRIGVNQLDGLLQPLRRNSQQAIELLVFSACETAAGDKRAALGIAGIAVKAGARSTVATLWAVNDAGTTEFMSQFYKELTNPKETKAEALRRAQLSLLQNPLYKHPIYWAPYVLVGNWL